MRFGGVDLIMSDKIRFDDISVYETHIPIYIFTMIREMRSAKLWQHEIWWSRSDQVSLDEIQ